MSTSSFPVKLLNKSRTEESLPTAIQLSTFDGGVSEIILDYGRAVGGIPFFETANVQSEDGKATLEIIYSETRAGIEKEKGTPLRQPLPTIRTSLTLNRRWPILVIFQCNGHIQSQHILLLPFTKEAMCRIKIRPKITKISEARSQITEFLNHIFLHRIQTSKTSRCSQKHFQMFK
jgi:hypothetical protein